MNDREKAMYQQMFADGAFVMLHPGCTIAGNKPHPDAGRIGKIVSSSNGNRIVQFMNDELIGHSTFCILPEKAWGPVPEFCVEEYEPRAGKKCFRLNERGVKIFKSMEWETSAHSEGKA